MKEEVQVTLGESTATLKSDGRSSVVVANVLGTELDSEGRPCKVWLDRLVHRYGMEFSGWEASGAISTVLTRC